MSEVNDDPVGRLLAALPDRSALIGGLREAAAREREAAIDKVALVAAAAEAYSWVDAGVTGTVLHGERLVQLGADGTPEVAEFLTLEVGPALGLSPWQAASLVGDVLDVRHRHPRLWALVLSGLVGFAAARRVAQVAAARGLDRSQADELDRRLEALAPSYTTTRLVNETVRLCEAIDPEGAEERRRAALADRFVAVSPGEGGCVDVVGRLDGAPGLRLDRTLTELAGILQERGLVDAGRSPELFPSGSSELFLDETARLARARALELLADPARAAGLLAGAGTPQGDDAGGVDGPGASGVGVAGTRLELEVRVRPDEVARGAGGEVVGLGPVARSQLDALVAGAARVVVRPVLDPFVPRVTSGYEPTPAQKREVRARDQFVAFPFSNRRAALPFVDADHVVEWPEGPTSTANLLSLGRTIHRAKTHGRFRLTAVRPGVAKWTTPAGQTYWVSPHGTFADDPAVERVLDPRGVRRRMREATRRAARVARLEARVARRRLEAEAARAARQMFDERHPALIAV